ncbi:MAG: glutaminase A [Acidimicrobiales bacterium]
MSSTPIVSTGALPSHEEVQALLEAAYAACIAIDEGEVADYIPALAAAPRDAFGACIAGSAGGLYEVGDTTTPFSMQSVSKPFVFALVCQAIGSEEAREKLGVNSTGLPFDSVMAIELGADRTMNPMVNAGAIATTSLVPGTTGPEKWQFVLDGLSAFAGRPLTLDRGVYASESAHNLRNQGIAHLLESYGRLYFDPDIATDVYTMQCSVLVNARDLAVMAATLADGGVNPQTGVRVIDTEHCKRVLAVLATAGLYEHSGKWLYETGLPGKSGVSGGIVTIAPGKGGVGTWSPPLDDAGNSVRGQALTHRLSEDLGLNLFASEAYRAP